MTAENETFRIRPGVAKVRRAQSIVLVAPEGGNSVRVSPIAEELMPMLADGARFDQLAARLQSNHPTVKDVETKLKGFLDQLSRSGLLNAEQAKRRQSRIAPRVVLFYPDALAKQAACGIQAIPKPIASMMFSLLLLGALAGIVGLIWQHSVPDWRDIYLAVDPVAIIIFAFLVVPLHEAAHAIACRLAGAEVGPAGLFFHGWVIPGPFVETTQAYQVRDRWKRFWIPAAGPVVDFLALGAAAWALLLFGHQDDGVRSVAGYLFLLCAVFLFLDTNPLTPSDGSRMVEAVLDDELARRSALSRKRALLSHWRVVSWYRVSCMVHLQVSLVIAYFWWAA